MGSKSKKGKPTSKNGRRLDKKPAKSGSGSGARAIHVVTDGTGGLPRHILAALLSQFPNLESPPRYHVFCDSREKVDQALRKVRNHSIVLHALVNPAAKQHVIDDARGKKDVAHYDLTGGLVTFLAETTGESPLNDLDCVHARDERYFDRIDAWEFTMQHDDSRRIESIADADIVLVGLSRVSKTPTAAYLGWLGYRVANVSYAPQVELPKELKQCRGKVVALSMQPKTLAEIRARRLEVNGFADAVARDESKEFRYASVRDTIREVMEAETVYQKMKFPIVDTTNSTVEETAARIIQLIMGKRAKVR
jgi:regulator of PEP synthase PpsR (kinase-PPPase family)